jgi:hypothetical protein
MKRKIRVGILIDSFKIPAWIYEILIQINKSNYAELVLIIKNDTEQNKTTLFNKIKKLKNQLFIYFTKTGQQILWNRE